MATRPNCGHFRTYKSYLFTETGEQVVFALKRMSSAFVWPLPESECCREPQKYLVEHSILMFGVRRIRAVKMWWKTPISHWPSQQTPPSSYGSALFFPYDGTQIQISFFWA
jgi:hypothetical protein